jgi:acyl-CoA dehydrogenase
VLEQAFLATVACEPIDRKLREAVKAGKLEARPGIDIVISAREKNILTAEECAQWQRKQALRKDVIKVDDFPQDFGRAEIVEKLSAEKSPFANAAKAA